MDERAPWEQQDGEPSRWYQRFNAFRLMGPGRSLQGCVNAERASKGRKGSGDAPRSWRKASEEWQWKARAQAWDQHLTNLAEAEVEDIWRKKIMGPVEVLGRLSDMARTNPQEFTHVDADGREIRLNEDALKERGYLVKSISTSTGKTNSVRVETYDAQSALRVIGEHHHLFERKEDEQGSGTTRIITLPADLLAPSFLTDYRDIRDHKHVEYLEYGGRGSTKSSFISLAIIYLLVNNPTMHAVALRQVADTLRISVYDQLNWAISALDEYYPGLEADFKCTTSPLEITYLPTGQKIYFRGADDPNKIKSIKPPFGYIGIAWFEELDSFHGPEAVRKIEQSAIRGGDLAFIFKSFNPPPTLNNWANKYVKVPKANQFKHESTYLDVPVEWLGKVFIEEAEYLKSVNPTAYEHEYLGVPSNAGGLVFENVEIRAITDEEIAQFDRVYYGLDWGYALDPLHWVKLHYDAAREIIYVFDEFRTPKMRNEDLYHVLTEQKRMTPADLMIADSAEPKSVADMVAYGLTCRGAEKGPDSVRYSMRWLQNRVKIVIDQTRAPAAAQEFLDYEYEQTKDGEWISEYPDKNNHAIDAVRYALNLIWRKRGQ